MDLGNTNPPPDPEVADLISITIKTIDSKNYKFEVESDIQIKSLKEKIAPQLQIEPEGQRMIFCGRVLADDKTLKDYKIDNGKVIHLVKRAPPRNDPANNGSNNNSNQQTDRNAPRIRRFQNQDGSSVFMGTFSVEPPANIFNQVMRQLFSSNRTGSDAPAGSTDPAHIRARFNQIRQLLCYIETNFQILRDPSHLPSTSVINAFTDDHTITLTDYISCFRDCLDYMDRLKVYLNVWLDSLNAPPPSSDPDETDDVPNNNFSIIMRIVHHLSHVFHSLTDFFIDPTNPDSPISVNVLQNNPSANSLNINIPSSNNENENRTNNEANNNNNNNQAQQPPPPSSQQPAAANPINLSSNPADMNSIGSRIGSFPGGVFVTQSPILLMEVDATINGNRTNLGTQAIPNFSISDLNVTINNMMNNASNFNFASLGRNPMMNSTGNSTQTSNNGGTTPSPIISDENSTPESRADGNTQAAADQNRNSNAAQSNNSDDANFNPFQMCSMRFDPFLNCNSSYTLPEIRSATNIGSIPSQTASRVVTDLNSNSLFSNLMEFLRMNPFDLDDVSYQQQQPQSGSELSQEFFRLIGFLIQQINQAPNENFDSIDSPRISDYLRTLNLFNSQEQTFMSDMLTNLFQNLNFEELYQMINFNFHDFGRLRQPFQESIRNNLLQGQEWTPENVQREIENVVSSNQEILANVVSNITPLPGIDATRSFQNFIEQTLIIFFNKIMNSPDDESFENDLISAIKYLATAYLQFCRVCFADPERARKVLIINFLNQYADFINERIRSFMSSIIIERINAYDTNLESDNTIANQVNSYLVRQPIPLASAPPPPSAPSAEEPQPMESDRPEHDAPSNSYDSEEVEFSDAYSDMPSTSNQPQARVSGSTTIQQSEDGQDWQSVVPSEWIPIIKEDIQKQKNIDNEHKPPFSDAYIAGMPKKRRLEHDQSKRISGSK